MEFQIIINKNKQEFIEKWYTLIMESYPKGAGSFFIEWKDQFSNPVGHAIHSEISLLFDSIINDDFQQISDSLANILRIRAVQDFTPSQALSFIFQFKEIAMHYLKKSNSDISDFIELDGMIDKVLGVGINIFVGLKEQLFEIKSNEVKKRFSRAVDRLNRKYSDTEDN